MPILQGLIQESLLSAQFAPFSVGVERLAGQGSWCSSQMSFFYPLEGSLTLGCGGLDATLGPDQPALAGPLQFCQGQSQGALVLWLTVDVAEARGHFPQAFSRPFRPFLPAGHSGAPLAELLAKALRLAGEAGGGSQLARQALALQLLETALIQFGHQPQAPQPSEEKLARIATELEWCAAHYPQPATPAQAAGRCYLSVPYFSKLFHQLVGHSYTEHLAQLRLDAAEALLGQARLPLHRIAQQCGFASARAFSAQYRQRHGHLPSQGRGAPPAPAPDLTFYLNRLEGGLAHAARLMRLQPPPIDCSAPGTPLPQPWRTTLALGPACQLNQPAPLAALAQAKQALGCSQLLVEDLFQLLPTRASQADPWNFAPALAALDTLLGLGFTPALRLQPPTNLPLGGWRELLSRFFRAICHRYGSTSIATWRFEPPPFPDRQPLTKLTGYFQLYRATFQAVKALVPAPCFCGPCLEPGTFQPDSAWLAEFLGRCREFGCLPDDLCTSFYPFDKGSPEPEPLAAFLKQTLATLGRMGLAYTQLWVEGFAPSPTPSPLADCPALAGLLAKQLLEAGDRLQGLCLPLLLESPSADGSPLSGQCGLFTAGQAAKSSFWALSLLARLGNRQLAAGDGYLLTAREDGLCLLLYNYAPPSAPNPPRRQFSLQLSGLTPGTWQRVGRLLNAQQAPLAQWQQMGSPSPATSEELAQLAALCRPALSRSSLATPDGTALIQQTLEPYSLHFIELWPQ